MTEAEWLAAIDPTPMLEFLRDKASDRKAILFCLSWCPGYAEEKYNNETLYDVALRYAEGNADVFDVRWAFLGLETVEGTKSLPEFPIDWAILLTGSDCESCHKTSPRFVAPSLIRDIFGNPFHPVTLNASWLASTVLALANGIYTERAFDRMPILADALQDAGCDNEDILNHCRQPGEHVRGCWVVDLLLAKS